MRAGLAAWASPCAGERDIIAPVAARAWENTILMGPIREDFAGQRQLRFRVRGETLNLFKSKGESTHHVYLKVLAYALYGDRGPLEFDPRTAYKHHPHLAAFDLTGRPTLWIHAGPIAVDEIAYLLKHSHADDVVLVEEHDPAEGETAEDFTDLDFSDRKARLARHIHYRYTRGKLKILVFRPLDDWFDPDQVELDPYNYHLVEF
jgi:hypothetical protein